MKSKQKIIKARRAKMLNDCSAPCLYCGSDITYICKSLRINSNYVEVSNHCKACGSKWVDVCNEKGVLHDISIEGLGTSWYPEDIK